MVYRVAGVTAGLALPRVEYAYFAADNHGMSVGSALVFVSAVSFGMFALTGIVFCRRN
jgi:hypothetical protein